MPVEGEQNRGGRGIDLTQIRALAVEKGIANAEEVQRLSDSEALNLIFEPGFSTAAKVTEVLADLILMAPPDEQSMLMADILANLGSFVLEKKEDADPTNPRRSRH